MSFTPLGDAIKSHHGDDSVLKKQADAGLVITAAEAVFKRLYSDIGEHARPQFLKNRTLTVACSSSAMAGEIRLNQNKIVQAINDEVGESVVDRIRYLS
jgi:predicted nucleic acid-binding Zn ribbon protein